MNVLAIGGTRFVGRHIVEALLAAGHRVTLFNRGISDPQAFPDVERVRGDRTADLHRLGGRRWDAVVDSSGYTPDVVEISARHFAERTGRYVFVSTISVYDFASHHPEPIDEEYPLAKLPPDADRKRMVSETYGALKVLCEAIVRSTYRHRATILRPGVVAGPHDPTDRFTYWPVRYDAGGTMIAPESPAQPTQYIDARDLAQFAVRLIENGDGGTYNAVTTPGTLGFGDLFDALRRISAAQTSLAWVDGTALRASGVEPWSDLPLWIPRDQPDIAHVRVSNARALVRGLRPRPIADTARDTLAWARSAGKRLGALAAGLSPEREAQILRRLSLRDAAGKQPLDGIR